MHPILVRDSGETFQGRQPVPPELFIEGEPTADTWLSESFAEARGLKIGIWVGQPGAIRVPAYPSDELFTVLSGAIALESTDGTTLQVGPGESCIVRKGWAGTWRTLAVTRKCYVVFNG